MNTTSNWLRNLLALAALGLMGVIGCSPSTKEIPFEAISEFPVSYYEQNEPKLILVLDGAELESLPGILSDFSELDKTMNETDFSRYCLLVAFQGEKGSGGYSIEILSIRQSGKKIKVRARFTSPESGATLGVTSPYHLVRIKMVDFVGSGKFTFTLIDDSSGKEVARATYTLP